MATSRRAYHTTTTVYTIINDIELFMEEGHRFNLTNQNFPYDIIALLRKKINDGIISPTDTFNDIYSMKSEEIRLDGFYILYSVMLMMIRDKALDRNKRTKLALRKMK